MKKNTKGKVNVDVFTLFIGIISFFFRKQQTFIEIEQRIFSCESYNARTITLPYKEQERHMEG